MTKYPNREALRKAHDIYLDAMREFIHKCLEGVLGTTPKELIMMALDCEPRNDFEVEIEINNIPHLIREYWDNCFRQKFDRHYDVRSATGVIKNGRNFWAHPGSRDLDPDYTNTHLFLVAEVLGKIGKTQAKHEVQNIWDDLCSDEPEEHPAEIENADLKERLAEMSVQLEMVKTEKAEYEDKSRRLEAEKVEYEELLDAVEKEKIEIETQLGTAPTRLNEMKAENTGLKKQLEDRSNRLSTTEAEKNDAQEQFTAKLVELEKAEAKQKEYEQRLTLTEAQNAKLEESHKVKSNKLKAAEMKNVAYEKRLKVKADLLEAAKAEKTKLERHIAELEERLATAGSERTELEEHLSLSDERVVLPTGKEMEQPVLEFLADSQEYRRIEIIDWLTEYFSLTDYERSYLSKSGQTEKHLMSRGLIERTRTGYYRITVNGLETLHQGETDEDSVFLNEMYTESQNYSESPVKSPKSQRKWRRPGAVAALRNPTEIREAEAKIARILNPSEKSRLERELREAKRAVFGSAT